MTSNYKNTTCYTRCVDNGYGIWDKISPETEHLWNKLKKDFDSYGKLKWKFSERSETAIFLNVKLTLKMESLQQPCVKRK